MLLVSSNSCFGFQNMKHVKCILLALIKDCTVRLWFCTLAARMCQKVQNPVKDIELSVQSETDKMHCQCGYSGTQSLGVERKQREISVFTSGAQSIHGSLTKLFATYLR